MSQGPLAPVFGVFSGVVDSTVTGTVHAGTPMIPSSTSTLKRGGATTATSIVCGILTRAAVKGEVASVQCTGPLSLEVAQWNQILPAESDGLVPGDAYYLSQTAGQLTNSAPGAGGTSDQIVGIALSQTTLLLLLAGEPTTRA